MWLRGHRDLTNLLNHKYWMSGSGSIIDKPQIKLEKQKIKENSPNSFYTNNNDCTIKTQIS